MAGAALGRAGRSLSRLGQQIPENEQLYPAEAYVTMSGTRHKCDGGSSRIALCSGSKPCDFHWRACHHAWSLIQFGAMAAP